jgi:hypothetical protein
MAQPKSDDKTIVSQILKLANQLTPGEQERLMDEMKLQWLRHEIQIGVDQADRGELIDGDEVFSELAKRYQTNGDQV